MPGELLIVMGIIMLILGLSTLKFKSSPYTPAFLFCALILCALGLVAVMTKSQFFPLRPGHQMLVSGNKDGSIYILTNDHGTISVRHEVDTVSRPELY